jgi:3-hydroxyisobutyrate dehydrogenase/2-hydroxy-3-oxopropionate reductase
MDAVVTALQGGAAGSWALSHRANSMLTSSYPLGFRMSLHHKDLGIALDAAGDVNLDLTLTQLVADLENGLMEQGHGDEDVSALHRHYCTKSW